MQIINNIVFNVPDGDKDGRNDKFNNRKFGVQKPDMIILHGTGCKNFDDAMETLYDPTSVKSAHYVIREDGAIFRMVPEENRSYHAGRSWWKDLGDSTQQSPDINSKSIGIEISNRADPVTGKRIPYTKEQIKSVTELCTYLMGKYSIEPKNVLGHSDIAPGRKQDPWENFPWRKLAKKGIGLWPKPRLADYFNNASVKKDEARVKELLRKIGYREPKKGDAITYSQFVEAFQLHYAQRDYKLHRGKVTGKTVAKMKAMARLQK